MRDILDILAFCTGNHISYVQEGHHHCHQGWVQLHCPWCSGEWTLGFNLEYGNFNCWRCGKKDVWDTIGRLLHTTNRSLVARMVHQFSRGGLPEPLKPKMKRRKRTLAPPLGLGGLGPQHRKYLLGRGYNPDTLEKDWELGGTAHLSKDWSWRVIIPIHNANGETIAYQGRAIKEGVRPKYKMTDDEDCLEDPKTILYGIDKAVGEAVLVVEGVTGVWRIGPGTVGTLGIDWKKAQANKLRGYKRRYILFDPEPKAQQRAEELANWLSYFPGITEIVDGFRTDPGEFSPRLARKVRCSLGL